VLIPCGLTCVAPQEQGGERQEVAGVEDCGEQVGDVGQEVQCWEDEAVGCGERGWVGQWVCEDNMWSHLLWLLEVTLMRGDGQACEEYRLELGPIRLTSGRSLSCQCSTPQ
jgi:hypothetical protein